jgi:hypothetical protein
LAEKNVCGTPGLKKFLWGNPTFEKTTFGPHLHFGNSKYNCQSSILTNTSIYLMSKVYFMKMSKVRGTLGGCPQNPRVLQNPG